MVGTKSPSSADSTYLRKVRKPLVEKRRRDRMNSSLEQLKSLLAVNIKQTSSTPLARLDKADILELTVSHLTTLEHQQRSVTLATEVDGYKKGFKDCARETIRYLSSTRSLDTDTLFKLNNHLQSAYIEKTRTPTASYPAEVGSAQVLTKPDVASTEDYLSSSFYVTYRPSYYNALCEQTNGATSNSVDNYGYDQFSMQYYNQCNDSVDTSLNSSCNMSLDSSSNVTPEKVLPSQVISDDVWRPW